MKKKIILTAIECFSNEGFFSTSMQRIAEECGMSKATLYKYFQSKEDLLMQVFEFTLLQMVERAKSIQLDHSLPKKERLRQRILVELQENKQYRAFLNLIFKVMPIQQNPRVMALMKRTKATFFHLHREYLLEAYGEEVEPYLWDLVMLLQGAIREYIHLLEDEQKPVNKEDVATLLASNLDQIIRNKEKPQPALSQELMYDYEGIHLGAQSKSTDQQIAEALISVQDKIAKAEMNRTEMEKVRAAYDSLRKKMTVEQPEPYLIEALCLFINSRVAIKQEIPMILALVEERRFN
ncbi:TetR/AcrR family transcriptional regulator [Halalkalibacter oceani]|uniref:TetR/AcrR family transcriptional regulator n=1 Tax=Halalkalibacter oceani TaxID=1653776 RepID=UPI00339B69B8